MKDQCKHAPQTVGPNRKNSSARRYFLLSTIFAFFFLLIIVFTLPFYKNPRYYTNPKTQRIKNLFHAIITDEEKEAFRAALEAFDNAVRFNVTYFIYGGTLLGSYRHHAMIPWDDDLDLLVKEGHKDALKECLESLEPEFELNTKYSYSWKLFHKDSLRTRLGWKWPFLDIFFYREDLTYIWDSHPSLRKVRYNKSNVFPLAERPFMGMMLPAPRKARLVLSQLYDLKSCQTTSWNHKEERKVKRNLIFDIPCANLTELFPFVNRENAYNETHVVETIENVYNTTQYNYTTFVLPI